MTRTSATDTSAQDIATHASTAGNAATNAKTDSQPDSQVTTQPDTRPMEIVTVSDGMGGTRHEWRPALPAKANKKTTRILPDPIAANPDSSAQQLKQIIERLENLEEEKRGIADDIRDVKAEAKATGFDVAAISAILKLRAMQPDNRMEAEAVLESYKCALGIV